MNKHTLTIVCLFSLALNAASVLPVGFAQDEAAKADDVHTVIVPANDKPFTVAQDDLVRLTGRGIAGSTITAEVKGPATLARTSNIRDVVGGRTPIGGMVREFEIQPTGKGKVTVTITVKFPTGGEPKVERYQFDVE